jgi:ESX secretion-associated protein EspB
MTQTLNVEYQELIARANEIEQPLPAIPSTNPPGPCEISFVKDAATQLALNADTMRLYLNTCEREWKTLAKSLRDAAKAYEEVDEGSAEAINSAMSGSGGTSASADGQMSVMCDPNGDFFGDGYLLMPPPPPPFQYPYYEVKTAAKQIEAGDQGIAFRAFAKEWDAFQRTFQKETINRFRPFTSWEGEARTAVEANFDQQRRWVISMVGLCNELASQANAVVDAHKKAALVTHKHAQDDEHPTTEEIALCDYWYKYYVTNNYNADDAILWYQNLQAQSEEALSRYVRNAQLPLSPLNPDRVPLAARFDAPNPNDGNGRGGDGDTPFDPNDPFNRGDLPSTVTPGMPSVPSIPSAGMPSTPPTPDIAKLDQALKDSKGSGGLPKGVGLKPASFGGGGVGMPSMPLQSATGAGATAGAAAVPGGGATGRGIPIPAAYAALGGGGGGMGMPLGAPGAQGRDAGKAKRVQSDQESLYTEERPWTEGLIGNRPRKASAEKQAS